MRKTNSVYPRGKKIRVCPWTMWPLTLTFVTFHLWAKGQIPHVKSFKIVCTCFVTWSPWPLTFTHDLDIVDVHLYIKFGDPKSNGSWDMNFFLVNLVQCYTDRQTESNAYEPTMHWHRWAQKWSNLTLLWAHLPLFGSLIWPWPTWPLTLTHVT